ncbi:hypothetical protein [Acetobacterium tundrae]|uniref:Capsid protein n=1 Tax=Acetobacterium tundrae TaxID=132932 RepID=A0ABR6WNK6_9FIRM|nr:hypothetical protein [Acetobacterium tundrae]MBC3798035.1 hypothetical protein [Acetobacterium tundrae]
MPKFKSNIYLTNMSMAYFQALEDYVAKAIFPICPVQLQTASYYKFSKGDLARDNVQPKPQFGKVPPAQFGISDETYNCNVDQVIVGIDQISALNYQRSNAPGVADPRRAKVKFVTEQLNNHLDLLFAKKFFKTGIWTDEMTGAATVADAAKQFLKFSDTNFDPVEFFDAQKTKIKQNGRRKPNKLALGAESYNALKSHPAIVERVKYTGSTPNPAIVNTQALAEILELKEVTVLESTYNAGKLGQTDMQYICDPKSALLCYASDSPAVDEPSAGYIFTWDMLGTGNYINVDQWVGEDGTHAEFIEGLMSTDMKKTGDDLAVFLTQCV